MLTKKEKKTLARFKTLLLQRFASEILEIRLFGSKARGTDTQKSDIDVLIITRSGDWKLKEEIGKIATLILVEDEVYLSVKVIGDSVFKNLQRLASPFSTQVLRDSLSL